MFSILLTFFALDASAVCPLQQKVGALNEPVGILKTQKTGRTLLALRDHSAAVPSLRLTLQFMNQTDTFKPGEYEISADGKVPGVCDHAKCVDLTFDLDGRTFGLSATSGKITLEQIEKRLVGRLDSVTFRPGMMILPAKCEDIVYDVSFDVELVDKRTPTEAN